ncbi:MAG TPA: hypothetical protein VK891_02125 [Euzebyales bacterium]|nr:hypothetical protein [Euzebyales bacterium]
MTASGTAQVLTLLLSCIRLLAAVLALVLATFAIRGEPLSLDRLVTVPRSVGEVITTSSGASQDATETVGRGRLRRQLQELFPHHATLVVRFMRSTVSDDPGFVDDAAVLIRNTDELRAVLAQIVDEEHSATFAREWQAQTQALFGYAAALRDDDAAARQQARSELAASVDTLTALLTQATEGHVDADTVATSLRMQIDLLLYQIDAYERGDFRQAYKLEREAYAHMYPFAATVAAGATGHPDGKVRTQPLEELTAQMSSLVGMHVELSVDALRAGAAGSDELPAATAALDANSKELSATLEGLLATRPSRQLRRLWAEQTDLLMRYAAAIAEDDPSVRRQVRSRLETVSARFERVLRTVTPNDGDAADAAEALHSQQVLLLDQIDAYAGDNHAKTHSIAYAAHHRVHDLAHTLAKIFVVGLPRGGAQTGGGGTALGG